MRNKYIIILVLVLIIAPILQSSYIIIKVNELKSAHVPVSGYSTGTVSFCIAKPPENITTDCPNSSREGVEVNCSFSADNPNPTGEVTFESTFLYTNEFFSITPEGDVEFATYSGNTGNYSHLLGNHTILITAMIETGCGYTQSSYLYELEVYDQNDPPYLVEDIPDQLIPLSQTVLLFNLNDYFIDPEGQQMTFTSGSVSGMVLTVFSSGVVTAFSSTCTEQTTTFTATDPGLLSATSNSVEITVNCEQGEEEPGSGSSGGSGGGGDKTITCVSDWQCNPWTKCTPNGTTVKHCIDVNACNPDFLVYELEDECTYHEWICNESWECTEWGECQPDNTQTRQCTDINGCDTEELKPETVQECEYIPTCSDNIQNQNESGIDCGGPCPPCKELQVPGTITEESTILSTVLIILVLVILSMLLVYKYFHKQINSAVLKFLLEKTKKKKKRILLEDNDKKYLLEKLVLKDKKKPESFKKRTIDMTMTCRELYMRIFNLPLTFKKNELVEKIKAFKLNNPLDSILLSFYDKIVGIETDKIKVNSTDLKILFEELTELIHLTSRFKETDIGKEEKEIAVPKDDKPVNRIKKQIFNTYIVMHFSELEVTKNKYSEVIKTYEELTEQEKTLFYEDIARLFNEIKYLFSVAKSK